MNDDESKGQQNSSWLSRNGCWLYPVAAMALVAPFTPYLDLKVASLFYHEGQAQPFSSSPLWTFLYNYGMLPGFVVLGVASLLYILSFVRPEWMRWRHPASVLILTLVIGAAGLVNVAFKGHWGRPRPRQVTEFGGAYAFRPFYSPNLQFGSQEENFRSFPCGHCSMGFYFLAVWLLGIRYRSRFLIVFGAAATILLSGLLAMARMAQGGHFLSDVLMSALIMWLTALLVDWYVHHKAPDWL